MMADSGSSVVAEVKVKDDVDEDELCIADQSLPGACSTDQLDIRDINASSKVGQVPGASADNQPQVVVSLQSMEQPDDGAEDGRAGGKSGAVRPTSNVKKAGDQDSETESETETCFKIDKVYSVTDGKDIKIVSNDKKVVEETVAGDKEDSANGTISVRTDIIKVKQDIKDVKIKDERAIKPRATRSGVAKVPSLAGVGGVRVLGGGVRGSNMPLIVSMGAGNPAIPLLPAGLPPGRYVILPGTSTSTTTKTTTCATVTTTTTSHNPRLATSIAPSVSQSLITAAAAAVAAASAQKSLTTTQPAAAAATTAATATTTPTPAPQPSPQPTASGRLYTRERGRRKSYTTGEKLAMIEAVESGQRKSAVADKFGVAPSTLACILAQKHKIRAEQDNLTRRRVRNPKYYLRDEFRRKRVLAPAMTLTTAPDTPFTHFLASLTAPATTPTPALLDSTSSPLLDTPTSTILDTQPEQIIAVPDLMQRLGGSGSRTSGGEAEANSDAEDDNLSLVEADTSPEIEIQQEVPQAKAKASQQQGKESSIDGGDEVASQDAGQQDTTSEESQGLIGPYLLKKETHCTTVLDQLLRDDTYTDVTLTAEGQSLRAHRIVLCLASPYFRQVLSKEMTVQSVILLRDVKFAELRNIIHFIYTGEATVDASELESFMRTAEMLEITSLCESQKCIASRGAASHGALTSSFTIGDFEKLVGAKRTRKDSGPRGSPPPSKTRKLSGGSQSSKPSSESAISDIPLGILKYESCDSLDAASLLADQVKSECKVEIACEEESSGRQRRESSGSIGGFAAIAGLQKDSTVEESSAEIFVSTSENAQPPPPHESSSPALTDCDVSAVPGRCPYCPHLPQKHEGMSMMRHLLVAHPCKPAFPCDQCWRVFVKRSNFKSHQSKCQALAF